MALISEGAAPYMWNLPCDAHIIIVMFKSGDPEKTRGFKSVFEEVMRRTFSLHPDALA